MLIGVFVVTSLVFMIYRIAAYFNTFAILAGDEPSKTNSLINEIPTLTHLPFCWDGKVVRFTKKLIGS